MWPQVSRNLSPASEVPPGRRDLLTRLGNARIEALLRVSTDVANVRRIAHESWLSGIVAKAYTQRLQGDDDGNIASVKDRFPLSLIPLVRIGYYESAGHLPDRGSVSFCAFP